MFGEKNTEYDIKSNKELPVWKSPKYEDAKAKAIEIIESKKYGLTEADFWILMNRTKTGKMMYSGLIISHNGCLKINDKLDDKFKPEYVTIDKDGYKGTLTCIYCCPEQGLFEVGEVSEKNCTNEYPYAMAVKRCFDRVVLKLSKLAYAGIYSDSESEDFKQDVKEEKKPEQKPLNVSKLKCEDCGAEILEAVYDKSKKQFGKGMCIKCQDKFVAGLFNE